MMIFAFLGAIIAANLLVTHFGPNALPFTAFFLIPFDLFSRDVLHEKWKGDKLWLRMLGLIAVGGVLSFILNKDAIPIAVASVCAFSAATTMNTVVYQVMDATSRFTKMNTSNAFAAVTDSLVFPLVAFGGLGLEIFIYQSAAKFIGGLFWTLLYRAWRPSGF